MREFHITIKGGHWLLVALGGILGSVAVLAAVLLYLFVVYDPFSKVNLRVNLSKQHVKAQLAGTFPVITEIDQKLSLPLQKTISVSIPFHQQLSIPLEKTLELPVVIDTTIPVALTVPIKADIPVDQEIKFDTTVETSMLGIPITVPVKGSFPVKTTIPVEQKVAVRKEFHLKLRSPVRAEIKDTFKTPIDTVINAEVPLDTTFEIPFKERISANVLLKGQGAEQIPNLYILDNALDIRLDQLQLVWKDQP